MPLLAKTLERLRTLPPREVLAQSWADARARLLDTDRRVLVLRLDLGDPKNRLRPRDRQGEVPALSPLTAAELPRVLAMLREHEPGRMDSVRQRLLLGARGLVAIHHGQPVGYVFWTEGSDHPARVTHADLPWLGVAPRRGEIYMFDYYVVPAHRGLGAAFARAVAEEHHAMGYTAAYGFVYQSNRPALWLYRTTGWKTVVETVEHRLLSRFAVVGSDLYWMHRYSRSRVLRLPAPVLAALADGTEHAPPRETEE